MKKWTAALVAAIVGPVVVWWITKDRPRAEVAIAAASLVFPNGGVAGRAGHMTVDIVNDGSRSARRCLITWTPSQELEKVTSQEFGVSPRGRQEVPPLVATYPKPGTFQSSVVVACEEPRDPDEAQTPDFTVVSRNPGPKPSPSVSSSPTVCPSPRASASPTPRASASPTPRPSASPSRSPVASPSPTVCPSAVPSASPIPTVSPSPSVIRFSKRGPLPIVRR